MISWIFLIKATVFSLLLPPSRSPRCYQACNNSCTISRIAFPRLNYLLSPTMRTSSIALLAILSAHEPPSVNSQRRTPGHKNEEPFVLGIAAPFPGGSTTNVKKRRIRGVASVATSNRITDNGLEPGGDEEGLSNVGGTCADQRVTKTWSDIELSPDNSIPRSTRLDSAFGTASVSLVRSERCYVGTHFEACMSADLYGSYQWQLHLTRGKIITNGPAVADFSDQMNEIQSGLNVCTPISESLFLELTDAPVSSK